MSKIFQSHFSILISIYHKEKPEYFDRAMQSIWDEQTMKPDEIVLVEDGKLTDELYEIIGKWKSKLEGILKTISLKQNVGLALALNEGLKYCNCNYDFIVRMDTDDISTPQRFEKQLEFLEKNPEIDVVGTYIREVDEQENIIKNIVEFPLTHSELYAFFSKRDPLAHPTTMFRKRFFKKAGNYPTHLLLAEDTLLWYNGFLQGCQFANLDFVGLKFRRSSEFYQRRANYNKSIGLLKYRLFKINRNLNFGIVADIYAVAYFIISVSPSFIKKILYKTLR
jgi:hypothetical protein